MIMSGKNTPHLSIESFHKLNRARNVSFCMHLHIRRCEADIEPLLWVPDIFSYISEDISAVLEEAKALGLCDNFTGNARIGQVSL
ncbi:Derepression protein [Salmonella enterica]|nr:Derepression protein [Salmonella enterica]EGG4133625.1 Derepression protein [Salmonella enterica]EIE1667697.1 Derepression protein [Salmonella enterica]